MSTAPHQPSATAIKACPACTRLVLGPVRCQCGANPWQPTWTVMWDGPSGLTLTREFMHRQDADACAAKVPERCGAVVIAT